MTVNITIEINFANQIAPSHTHDEHGVASTATALKSSSSRSTPSAELQQTSCGQTLLRTLTTADASLIAVQLLVPASTAALPVLVYQRYTCLIQAVHDLLAYCRFARGCSSCYSCGSPMTSKRKEGSSDMACMHVRSPYCTQQAVARPAATARHTGIANKQHNIEYVFCDSPV
jgi:hypothetical protein